MAPADKAALRLTVGLGVAALVAYGFALPMPFVVCVMAAILLSKPGPPMPLARGAATALVLAIMLTAGVLMVPVLENYALTGVLLTATVLYAVFYKGLRAANPVTMVLVMAFALIAGGRRCGSGPGGHVEPDGRHRRGGRRRGQVPVLCPVSGRASRRSEVAGRPFVESRDGRVDRTARDGRS